MGHSLWGRGTFARTVAPFAIALTLSTSFSTFAWADAGSDLDMGEAAYAALDYDRANGIAQKVVAQHGLTHDQLVRAYRLLGRTYAVLGKGQQATDSFQKLLTYDPDEKNDPSQPPKIQDAFSEAQGFWAGYQTKPGIEASTVALRVGHPGTLRVHLHDPTHVAKKVVVGYRWGGTGNFATSDAAPGETVNIDIPAGPPNVARFDYYAQAVDDRDDAVFTAGDASSPKTQLAEMTPTQPAGGIGSHAGTGSEGGGKSIFASPVFWVIAGVLVAGATTTVILVTRKPTDVTLPPTSANLSPSLFCGGTADGHCH